MSDPLPLSMRMIVRCVAEYFGADERMIYARSRNPEHSHPRHIACWLGRAIAGLSFVDIGRALAGRDHTTAMNSFNVIEATRWAEPGAQADLDALSEIVRAVARVELADRLPDIDAVAVARRLSAMHDPLREAARVSTLQIVAMATRLVELDAALAALGRVTDPDHITDQPNEAPHGQDPDRPDAARATVE